MIRIPASLCPLLLAGCIDGLEFSLFTPVPAGRGADTLEGEPGSPGIGTGAPPSPLPCAVMADSSLVAACGANAAMIGGVGYPTVGAAVSASAPGDEIIVCPGVWDAHFDVFHSLTLRAADPREGMTVLSGGGTRRIITAERGTNLVIEGLTLQDGWSAYSAGSLSFGPGGHLTMNCSVVEGSFSGYEAGGVEIYEATATISGSIFRNNFADYEGGALEINGWDPSSAVIEDCVFENNRSGYAGGALAVGSWAFDEVFVINSTFTNNAAASEGGAIAAGSWGGGLTTVEGGAFIGNTAGHEGGAIATGFQGTEVDVTGAVFDGNDAPTDPDISRKAAAASARWPPVGAARGELESRSISRWICCSACSTPGAWKPSDHLGRFVLELIRGSDRRPFTAAP